MNNAIENFKEILSLPCVNIETHRFDQLRIFVEMQKERGSHL
jgi:hypothetical protein